MASCELLGACLIATHRLPALYTAGWCEMQEQLIRCTDWTLCKAGHSGSAPLRAACSYTQHTYCLACKGLSSTAVAESLGVCWHPLQALPGPEAAAHMPTRGSHPLESCKPSTRADMTSPGALQEQDGCGRFVAYLAMTVLTLFELPALQQPYPDCAVLTSVVPAVMRATKRIAAGQCKHRFCSLAWHNPGTSLAG